MKTVRVSQIAHRASRMRRMRIGEAKKRRNLFYDELIQIIPFKGHGACMVIIAKSKAGLNGRLINE